MMNLRNQTVNSETFMLLEDATHVLGPNVDLTKCEIVLQLNAKRLTLIDPVKFVDCDIKAKRQLTNFLWHNAFLLDCRFQGLFVGNCFGRRLDESPAGGIDRCDFAHAVLDGCTFYECNKDSIILPRWPCFTLWNPAEYIDQMTKLSWPGRLESWVRSFSCFPLANIAAVTEYAPKLTKKYQVSEEELISSISRLPNLQLN